MQTMSDAVLLGLCFRPWISLPAGLCSMSTAFMNWRYSGNAIDRCRNRTHRGKSLGTCTSLERPG